MSTLMISMSGLANFMSRLIRATSKLMIFMSTFMDSMSTLVIFMSALMISMSGLMELHIALMDFMSLLMKLHILLAREAAPDSDQIPMIVTTIVRRCGAARCSNRKIPCQVPSCIRPRPIGTTSLVCVRTMRRCEVVSSGPSAVCT